jgi:elongation factor G
VSVLLEPVMKFEVVTPWDCVERVIGDLESRRGEIKGRDARGDTIAVTAFVPLATMFGYVNVLRPMSRGRATYTMEFDHYAPVPLSDGDPPFRPAAAMRA